MIEQVVVQRIAAGSVFMLVGVGLAFSIIPFSVLMGVFALFGSSTVSWNGSPIVGVQGLLASPFIGAFITGLSTLLVGAAMVFGLWVYSWFRPLTFFARSPVERSRQH